MSRSFTAFPCTQLGMGVFKPLICMLASIYILKADISLYLLLSLRFELFTFWGEWIDHQNWEIWLCYSLTYTGCINIMTLWQSHFPQNVRNTHFGIGFCSQFSPGLSNCTKPRCPLDLPSSHWGMASFGRCWTGISLMWLACGYCCLMNSLNAGWWLFQYPNQSFSSKAYDVVSIHCGNVSQVTCFHDTPDWGSLAHSIGCGSF